MPLDHEVAAKVIKAGDHIAEKIVAATDALNAMHAGKKTSLKDLSEIFIIARRFNETIETARKLITKLVLDPLQHEKIPERFDDEGITTFTTDSGFRITSTQRYSVSIIPEEREKAMQWLRDHDLGPLITETVNSQTLSAHARQQIEAGGAELPADLFKASTTPALSVTQVKQTTAAKAKSTTAVPKAKAKTPSKSKSK